MPGIYLISLILFLAFVWGILFAIKWWAFSKGEMPKIKIVYDGRCPFCSKSMQRLKRWDCFKTLEAVDLHAYENTSDIHCDLKKEAAMSQIHVIDSGGTLYGGFEAAQRLCLLLPTLYPLAIVFYFPGAHVIGPLVYRNIARNRYQCHNERCRKE